MAKAKSKAPQSDEAIEFTEVGMRSEWDASDDAREYNLKIRFHEPEEKTFYVATAAFMAVISLCQAADYDFNDVVDHALLCLGMNDKPSGKPDNFN